ncbi:TRAP transporter large permease [Chloroflexota bacterium]
MTGLLTLFVLIFLFLAMGIPVGFSVGISSVLVMVFFLNIDPSQMIYSMSGMVDKWVWVAIPLFLVLGNLMNETGVISRIVDFAQALIGHITGALSHVVVLAHIMMAGMSGSISADAAAIGTAMTSSMKKAGYSPGYIAAVVGCGAVIGPMIPPSVPLIVFGVVAEESILRLWLGGAVPGLLIGAVLLVVGYIRCRGRGYEAVEAATWTRRGRTFVSAVPALLLPVVILGGMRLGIFTATEGAGAGIFYILVIAIAFYRWKNLKGFISILASTGRLSAAIMFMIVMVSTCIFALATLGSGPLLAEFLTSLTTNPVLFLLMVVVVFIFLGCFIEGLPLVLIFVPLLMPTVDAYGIDPVHFGVLFTYVTMIAMLTPPIGATMYLVCKIADTDIVEYTKEAWPFLVGLMFVALLLTFFPQIVTFLPDLVMGKAMY